MKQSILLKISLILITFLFCPPGQAMSLTGEVSLPVMGNVLDESSNERGVKYIVHSDSTKAYSPMDGSVYYVGRLKDYGLSIIVKNAHQVAIIGNLDRAYVVKNQYLLHGDNLGSVAYHSKIIFIVQQIRRTPQDYIPPQQQNNPLDFAQKFQDKLLKFAQNGGQFLKQVVKNNSVNSGRDKILNYHEVTNLLKDTGFPEKAIPMMYCIAKWESGLNPKALNFNNNNTVDVGLFQINSTWFKKCDATIATLYDEKENTRCALTVLKNQGFPAWTTYNKYKNTEYCG